MKRISIFLLCMVALTTTAFAGTEKVKGEESKMTLDKLAKISAEKAQSLALQKAPGKILESDLEVENGLLIYSYNIQTNDHRIMEVQTNAKDGSIVIAQEEIPSKEEMENKESEKGNTAQEDEERGGTKIEAEEKKETEEAQEKETSDDETSELIGSIAVKTDTNLAALAKITTQQANASASKLVEGKIKKTELENEDGYLVYKVTVDYDAAEYEVLIDAGNGYVLTIEVED
jgi:uncharacterized membrane protein YkoI